MRNNFKFFRGDERQISIDEWNRRRYVLAERYRLESEERSRNNEALQSLIRYNQEKEAEDAARRVLSMLNEKPTLWQRIKSDLLVVWNDLDKEGIYTILIVLFSMFMVTLFTHLK
jgi:hypothetical protein